MISKKSYIGLRPKIPRNEAREESRSHIRDRNKAEHMVAERKVLDMITRSVFPVGFHYAFQTVVTLCFVLDFPLAVVRIAESTCLRHFNPLKANEQTFLNALLSSKRQ
uniref:Uncharacterized protein n=1 Tax=Glossina brevipalpis TaxID=37001 RepID=A0A1A9WTU7_9MUSC